MAHCIAAQNGFSFSSLAAEVWYIRLGPSRITGQHAAVLGTVQGKHSPGYTHLLEIPITEGNVLVYGAACKEHGPEEQRSPANCPQSDRSFVEPDLARPWSTLELGLSSCKEKQLRPVCSYLDRAAMLSRLQQRLFFYFTAVLFIADFGLPPLAAFPRM